MQVFFTISEKGKIERNINVLSILAETFTKRKKEHHGHKIVREDPGMLITGVIHSELFRFQSKKKNLR